MSGRPMDEPDIDSPPRGTQNSGGGRDGQESDGVVGGSPIGGLSESPAQSPVPSPRAAPVTLQAFFLCNFACADQRHASARVWHWCAVGKARVQAQVCRSLVDKTVLKLTFRVCGTNFQAKRRPSSWEYHGH